MKKFILMTLMLTMVVFTTMAQHYNVRGNNYSKVEVSFTSAPLQVQKMITPEGTFSRISMEDYNPSVKVGNPELPVMVKLLEIPLCDSVIATVTNVEYQDYDATELGINYPIYPAQPAYAKSYTGEKRFAKDALTYANNAFYALPLVSVEKVGVMRDVNLANISVSPVMYNPVTNKVRVYTRVNVEVTYVNANVPATYEMKAKYGSPMFQTAQNAVINPQEQSRDEFSQAPIRYLIIAHSMFENNSQLAEFVNWKKRIGYLVDVAYTSTIGTTTTAIKNYILSQYENATAANPAPTFILLIGDHAQIPAFSSTEQNSHVTDLYYACLNGSDNIPDCYYGRFSAQNVAQLTPQIEKTLMYEQFTMPDPSYLGKSVLIAGTDSYYGPTHAQGQINYVYDNYINTTTTHHNYTTVYKHNYNCSSEAAAIRSEVSGGSGWTNYTAHGSETGWADPSFSTSNVSALQNEGKYGVMIGNCCLTGKFNVSQDCFGEVLLRTANKGAVAYIGASEVSYWSEDYYWAVGKRSNCTASPTYDANNLGTYDKMFHTHGESHNNWNTTLGGLVQGGNLAVQSSTSSLRKYYWEIYHIFGDPSLKPYLGIPATMNVTADDAIVVGSSSYTVNAVPYAYVALTYNGQLVSAAFANASGVATLNTSSATTPGEYELAIGAQNYIQYFKTVNVIVPAGPYVMVSDVALAANNETVCGSTVNFDLTLNNVGVDAAATVTVQMAPQTAGVVMTQGTATASNLGASATVTLNNAFSATIPQNLIDGTILRFHVTASWNGGSSEKDVYFTAKAPHLMVESMTVTPTGGATVVAPGSQATITIANVNDGHANLSGATAVLSSRYSGVHVISGGVTLPSIAVGQSGVSTYTVAVDDDAINNSTVRLYYYVTYNELTYVDTLNLVVGYATEDFESGDFSIFPWNNTANYNWQITNVAPYEGNYCARSNSSLSHSQTSALTITMTSEQSGSFSYYRKVSSEANYDKFSFTIDNSKKEEISGEEDWAQKTYNVSAGTHMYTFEYSKDYSESAGSDCAFIDNIRFPGLGNVAPEDTNDYTGIEDVEIHLFTVYPNPTNNMLNVRTSEPIQQLVVCDMSGRVMEVVNNCEGDIVRLNVANYATGIYFVKAIFRNNQVQTLKFVKQ